LKNKIYCYGGSLIGARNEEIVDSNMFVLDITQSNASTMNDLGNNWKAISPNTAGVIVEKRTYSQTAVIGGTQLLLSGGFGGANSDTALVDQTIVYDAESNSWKKYPNYIEGSFGNRQM
jgi:N-acetylneuraminic acid mutarotase